MKFIKKAIISAKVIPCLPPNAAPPQTRSNVSTTISIAVFIIFILSSSLHVKNLYPEISSVAIPCRNKGLAGYFMFSYLFPALLPAHLF
jgi:hypothetical protein